MKIFRLSSKNFLKIFLSQLDALMSLKLVKRRLAKFLRLLKKFFPVVASNISCLNLLEMNFLLENFCVPLKSFVQLHILIWSPILTLLGMDCIMENFWVPLKKFVPIFFIGVRPNRRSTYISRWDSNLVKCSSPS